MPNVPLTMVPTALTLDNNDRNTSYEQAVFDGGGVCERDENSGGEATTRREPAAVTQPEGKTTDA